MDDHSGKNPNIPALIRETMTALQRSRAEQVLGPRDRLKPWNSTKPQRLCQFTYRWPDALR